MALDPVVNFFRSTIATLPLNSGTTTMVLASGDGNKLPDPSVDGAFNLVVYDPSDPFVAPEIVRCTARTSDTLTISRGQEGTSDATKAAGIAWTVELVPTAKTIQDIDSTKVNVADIVNNLTSTDTNKPLSANQGKVLQDNKVATASIVNDLTSGGTTVPLSAEQGKVLQDGKVAKAGDTMTGTLTATKLIPSGNVTAGNGMYLPATNTLAFSTNGAERVRVDASGNVGIGTTSPDMAITVSRSSDTTELRLINTGSASQFKYTALFQGSSSTAVTAWDESGVLEATSTGGLYLGAFAGPIRLHTGSDRTERLRITSAGNVGIGTTSPTGKLDVRSGNGLTVGDSNAASHKVLAGRLPETGVTSGLFKYVFEFTMSGTFRVALIELSLAAGLATTGHAKYIFAVKTSADSGNTCSLVGSVNNVFQDGFSNFTFAATSNDRKFTVTITRPGTENWSVFGGYSIVTTVNVPDITFNSVTAIP